MSTTPAELAVSHIEGMDADEHPQGRNRFEESHAITEVVLDGAVVALPSIVDDVGEGRAEDPVRAEALLGGDEQPVPGLLG